MKTPFELFQQAIELENALYLAWLRAKSIDHNKTRAERIAPIRARAFQRIFRRKAVL